MKKNTTKETIAAMKALPQTVKTQADRADSAPLSAGFFSASLATHHF